MREMKDSGVEWIGKIPKDWEIVPLTKQLDSIVDYRGKTPEKTEEGTFLVTAKNIKDGKICYELSKEYVREADYEEIMHRGIPQIGDILFTTEAPLGQVANVDRTDIALAQRIIKFRALSTVNNYYLKYWMLNEGFQQFLHSLSTGSTATGIKSSKLFLLPLVRPNIEQQNKIVEYLDAKCSKIDEIVEKQKVIIEKLEEYKLSIITEAVTSGINPDVEMKDSGSVWFGNIPINWEMKRLKYVFHIQKDIAGEEGHTVLSITQRGIIPKDFSNNEGQFANSYANYQLVHKGDFAMNHMDLLTGWVDISKYEGVTSPDYRVFVLNDKNGMCPKYYLYMMQMCYSARIFYGLGQGVSGMGRWRLQADKFLNFYIPIPPFNELVVMSPFLSESVIADFNLTDRALSDCKRTLVTRRSELGKLKASDVDNFTIYALKDEIIDGEEEISDELADKKKQDIHAKIYLRRKYSDVDLYLGSMNASYSAINKNVEMMLWLGTKNMYLNGDKFLEDIFCGPVGDAKNPFEQVTVADAVLETESDNRNLLEQKIKDLCRVKRQAVISEDNENAGKYKIEVEFSGIESDSEVTVSPFNSKQEQTLSEHIEFSELEILQLSEFYEITARSGDDTIRRIIMIPTSGFPDDRESAAVNSVVKDRASFVEYIAFVLGDDYVASMLEGKQMGESGFFANSSDAMPALYEKMLKTSVEGPERIKDIGYVLKMVTDKDIIPDEFRELYETFCNTLKIRR